MERRGGHHGTVPAFRRARLRARPPPQSPQKCSAQLVRETRTAGCSAPVGSDQRGSLLLGVAGLPSIEAAEGLRSAPPAWARWARRSAASRFSSACLPAISAIRRAWRSAELSRYLVDSVEWLTLFLRGAITVALVVVGWAAQTTRRSERPRAPVRLRARPREGDCDGGGEVSVTTVIEPTGLV